MPNILDELPYPWPKKEAQQLHITLCQLIPTVSNAVLVAQKVGIQAFEIFTEQAVYLVWAQILNLAAVNGQLRKLVKEVLDRQADTSPARPFLQDLLNNKLVTLDPEPRGPDGMPKFLSGTDEITTPEALLYRDDLTLQVGKLPQLINTLQKMVALAPAVCRLSVAIDPRTQTGTGFRIGKDLILTNWHVLHREDDGQKANGVTAEFHYEDNGEGGFLNPKLIRCDVNTIITSKEDDWAVIRTTEVMLDEWPIIKLSEAVAPRANSTAYIIQHPGGERKRIGFIRNQVSDFNDRLVHYLTDTQEGSSGAPVFDQSGNLFALHHAGGRPQEVLGKPPMSKNEGIRISRVVQGLTDQGVLFS